MKCPDCVGSGGHPPTPADLRRRGPGLMACSRCWGAGHVPHFLVDGAIHQTEDEARLAATGGEFIRVDTYRVRADVCTHIR